MLPGFRILLALVVLSFAILMFGFSALALLRTAHQNLASQPTWQPSWRTPAEIANTQRDDRQQRESEMQTLALLRVEPSPPEPAPETRDVTSPVPASSAAQQQLDDATPDSVSADAESPQPTQKTAANGDGRAAPAASPEPDAAVDKASAQATTLPAVDNAKPVSSNASAALEAPHTANPPGQNDASEPPTAAPTTTVPSPSATDVASEPSTTEPEAPKPESPTRLAALPNATASGEPMPQAGSEGVKKPDAAELRARRHARARLYARRLAMARARAARLAQTQQPTGSSPFYGSNFPSPQNPANPQNATPNATPFNPPRGAP